MKNSPRKKAIALCILFAVVYITHGLSGSLYTIYQVHRTGVFAIVALSAFLVLNAIGIIAVLIYRAIG